MVLSVKTCTCFFKSNANEYTISAVCLFVFYFEVFDKILMSLNIFWTIKLVYRMLLNMSHTLTMVCT